VYRGHPFVIEAGLAWGHGGGDRPAQVLRLANRTPLLFGAGGCVLTQAVIDTNWSAYGVAHARGALPQGPLVILLHVASVWVPYTSESKEAVAAYPEIEHELRLALQACGRRLAHHLAEARRERDANHRRLEIERYVPHIGIALQDLLDLPDARRDALVETIDRVLRHDEEERAHAG
jgi:DNA topoisomerase-6 subunit B